MFTVDELVEQMTRAFVGGGGELLPDLMPQPWTAGTTETDTVTDTDFASPQDTIKLDIVTDDRDITDISAEERASVQHGLAPDFNAKRWFRTYDNGQIPSNALVGVGGGHMLRPDAAAAYKAMRRAARKDGVNITLTDSYRDLATQERLAAEKGLYSQGGLAAKPGTSNHGWGLAVDVASGTEWLAKNGGKFGFATIDREPWHWEYRGGYAGAYTKPKQQKGAARKIRKNAPPTPDLITAVDPATQIQLGFTGLMGEVRGSAKVRRPDVQNPGLDFAPARLRKFFKEAAETYGVNARLLAAIAKFESNFDPKAVSSAGAQGVMQIMPLHGLENPYNARANILKGAAIFASYLNKAKGNVRLALAYYNAGPNADQATLEARMAAYSQPIIDFWRNG